MLFDKELGVSFDPETGEVVGEVVGGAVDEYEVSPLSRDNLDNGQQIWYDQETHKPLRLSNPLLAEQRREFVGNGMKFKRVAEGINEMLIDGSLTIQQMRVFAYIGGNVVYNNLSYFTIKDVEATLSMTKAMVSKALKELESEGLITEVERNSFGVGSRVYEVNPFYFWFGDYSVRYSKMLKNLLKASLHNKRNTV